MTDFQQRLTAHWIKHMGQQPEYVIDAIKRYFERCPEDRTAMHAVLMAEYKRVTG